MSWSMDELVCGWVGLWMRWSVDEMAWPSWSVDEMTKMASLDTWSRETLFSIWTIFSLLWILSWSVLLHEFEKFLSQYEHWYLVWFLFGVDPFMPGLITWMLETLLTVCTFYGLSLVWILSWLVLLLETEKLLSQYAHWYGFSLVWILSCLVLLLEFEKFLSQYEHWYGFSLVWIISWLVLILDLEKLFSQYEHWYGFSLVWWILSW